MFKVTTLWMVSALALLSVTSGCANKNNVSIAHLERANRVITGQLNRSRGELDSGIHSVLERMRLRLSSMDG